MQIVQTGRGLDREGREGLRRQSSRQKGKLQLIVLDHASSEVWGGIDGVVGLPEWRDGTNLVPVECLSLNPLAVIGSSDVGWRLSVRKRHPLKKNLVLPQPRSPHTGVRFF